MTPVVVCVLSAALFLCSSSALAGSAQLSTRRVATGLDKPTFICAAPGDATRMFILEQYTGQIRILDLATNTLKAAPFLTISAGTTGKAILAGTEQGLHGMAFHPDYANNGFFYVCYISNGGGLPSGFRTIVERYQVTADPNVADPTSATAVLSYDRPEDNNNGGWLGFGPNGFLYIGSGDGGGSDDRHGAIGNGQDINSLLGKILRIDISDDAFPLDPNANYKIPGTNPFAGPTLGRDEIWAYGLRHPWRPSFDRTTGDLYIADVGNITREEVNFQAASSLGGQNYGWRPREGTQPNPSYDSDNNPYPFENPVTAETPPIHDALHPTVGVIIGGYVYRGSAIPGLQGTYFYGDYATNKIWSFAYTGTFIPSATDRTTELAPGLGQINKISSFGEDASGELYICDYLDGEIYKIIPALQITTANPISDRTVNVAFSQGFVAFGGVAPYTWSRISGALPSGMSLAADGTLSGTPNTAGPTGFTIQVADNLGVLAIKAFSFLINAAPAVSTANPLPNGNVATAYSQQLALTGGSSPFTWSISAGTLPAGLSLASGGLLSGTPSASGAFAFTAQVSDGSGVIATKAYNLTISNTLVIVTTSPLPAGVKNQAYAQTLTAAGGTPPYSWFISAGLPPSGVFLAGNGDLSGTPSAIETATFTAQVTDSTSAVLSRSFSITINSGAPSITSTAITTAAVGTAYSYTVQATGAPAPNFTLSASPAGMTINSLAGVISWVPPSVGSFQVSVLAANGTLPNSTQSFTLSVGLPYGLNTRLPVSPYLNMPTTISGTLPQVLSGVGAFSDVLSLTTNTNLIPFTLNSPLWSDGAFKKRWIALPNDGLPYGPTETVAFAPTGEWTFPTGTVFVKHFEMGIDDRNPAIRKRLETRVLVVQTTGQPYGVSYKWNDAMTDAVLLPNGLNEDLTITTVSGGTRIQTYAYPSRSECIDCHNPNAGGILGVKTRQQNSDLLYPSTGVTDNQLRTWNHIGMFSTTLDESTIPSLTKTVPLTDTSATLENRVRSYLDSNCSHCHRPGVAPANWDGRYDTALISQNIIDGPVNNNLGITGAREVLAGAVPRSIMHMRVDTDGTSTIRMPPLARNVRDTLFVNTLSDWINGLAPAPSIVSAPVPSVTPATSGVEISFSAAATNVATWLWEFGDNTTSSSAGTATHVYAAPGNYTVKLTITNVAGVSSSMTFSVTAIAAGNGDTDNDGISDAAEFAAGTDPFNAASAPSVPFVVTKLKGKANFKLTGKDSASFSAVLPAQPAKLDPTDKTIIVDIDGARESIPLTVKGKGKTLNASVTLKLKPSKKNPLTKKVEFLGGPVPIKVTLSKGSWVDDWLEDGIDPDQSATNGSVTFTVGVIFNDALYRKDVETTFKSKAKKGGSFKQK